MQLRIVAVYRSLRTGHLLFLQTGGSMWRPMICAALAPASAMRPVANSNRFSFSSATLRCKRPNGTSDARRILEKPSMIDFESHPQTGCFRSPGLSRDNPVYHAKRFRYENADCRGWCRPSSPERMALTVFRTQTSCVGCLRPLEAQ